MMRSGLVAGLVMALTIFLACAQTFAAETPAAPTASSVPPTLWSFLGLKQCADKCKEHLILHKEKKAEKQALQGGHPCLKHLFGQHCLCPCAKCQLLKKKPPLKPLADAANLESQNPAIKAAAEIKAEEDLAPQKVKAIRYLATLGCGCYPQVKPALLAALDDCTEEVRYEAALAFCRSAGNPCTVCNSSTCCAPDVRDKLRDLAVGTDEQGCWQEPSSRVRSAAASALNMCEMIAPSEPELSPEDESRELPVPEMAPGENGSETAARDPGSRAPTVVALPTGAIRLSDGAPDDPRAAPAEGSSGGSAAVRSVASSARGTNDVSARPVGRSTTGGAAAPQRSKAPSQQKPGTGKPREPAEPGEPWDEQTLPGEDELSPDLMEPSPLDLAGTFGAASGPHSAAPYMIGDFFGGTACQATVVRSFTFNNLALQWGQENNFYTVLQDQNLTRVALHDQYPDVASPSFPITDANDASGRLGGAPLGPVPAGGTFLGGTTTWQSVPGGDDEQTDLYTSQFQMGYVVAIASPGSGGGVGRTKIAENTSPMPRDRLIFDYSYFDNVPLAPGGMGVNRFTLGFEKTFVDGNMSFELKAPMASTVDSTVVQGFAVGQRSGEFGNLALAVKALLRQTETWAVSGGLQLGLPTADDSRVVLAIRNDAVRLAPFLGALWTPSERLFSQGFLQCDIASGGNAVLVNRDGWRLSEVGRLNDANLLTVDWGVGYWAMQNSCRQQALTGLAWTAELHWTRSLQRADMVEAGPWAVTCGDQAASGSGGEIDVLNLTLGCHVALRQKTLVTCGYAVPLYADGSDPFDGEFRVMVNHHFGSASRLTPYF